MNNCEFFSRTNSESEEDFDFIDPSILQQFKRTSVSVEKIQKELFNFDKKGKNYFEGNRK